MREVWEDLQNWRRNGQPAALATVVKTSGSALRTPGAKMAVNAGGHISGSVTGGCVEGAVFEEAQQVIKSGAPRLLTFGGPDTDWDVGLVCGGSIQVFVESMMTEAWQVVLPALEEVFQAHKPAILVTVVDGPNLGKKLIRFADGRQMGNLGADATNRTASNLFQAEAASYTPRLVSLSHIGGENSLFIEYFLPPPRLVIVGAVHLAIPLAALAQTMNYRTTVVDARLAFATPERFPEVDELIVDWPGEALPKLDLDASTAVVCLSHDPKLDNPALLAAINSPAGYIGALGSRRAHAKRLDDLREAGSAETDLQRIHAPIGLDLGGRDPEEIALAIMAEIIAERHKASVRLR